MNRTQILATAEPIISSDREEQYGKPEENYRAIGEMWASYLTGVLNKNGLAVCGRRPHEEHQLVIQPEDALVMMALVKIGRMSTGQVKDDTYVDAAGYIALAGEIATE